MLGVIRGTNVHNVSIRGRGILAGSFLPGEPVPMTMVCHSCTECNESYGQNIFLDGGSNVSIEGERLFLDMHW